MQAEHTDMLPMGTVLIVCTGRYTAAHGPLQMSSMVTKDEKTGCDQLFFPLGKFGSVSTVRSNPLNTGA